MNRDRDPIFDPLAPEVLADPHPCYRRLRETGSCYWHGQLDAWVVPDYARCCEVLGDVARFSSDFRRTGASIPAAALSIQALDPPEHSAIRHLLVSALHGQPPTRLERSIRAVLHTRLRQWLTQGSPWDVVAGVARPGALGSICRILGVEPPDGARFEACSNAIVRSMDAGLDPERAAPGDRARAELSQLVGGWLRKPRDSGLIHAAKRAHAATPGVSEELLASSLRAVLHAGYESVSRLLSNAMSALAQRPDLLPQVTCREEVDALVDELIRLEGPVQADARVCIFDTDLGGNQIARGSVVVVLLAAANRDPSVFPDPDEILLTNRRRPHVSFGKGPHACLGNVVARMELRALVDFLIEHRINVGLAGEPVPDGTATLRGLRSLMARPEPWPASDDVRGAGPAAGGVVR